MKKAKNWPKRKDIEEVLGRLLSDDVMGSTVLSPDAPLVDQIKWDLCAQIVKYHLSHKTSQDQLAQKLDVDAPEMSRLLHYKIERYTIDRLIRYVEILYPKLSLSIQVHAA